MKEPGKVQIRLNAAAVRGIDPDACWGWKGALDKDGYAKLTVAVDGKPVRHRANRASFQIFNGPIPEGLCVLHSCDNRACTNPRHLFLGTQGDNAKDMVAKRRHVFGDRHPTRKLNSDQVVEIRAAAAMGEQQKKIAARFGVVPQLVNSIVLRRIWRSF